jgi:hypothetical protein
MESEKIGIESQITKEILLSIDDDIKNTIRSLDTSYETDKLIEKVLQKNIEYCIKHMRIKKEKILIT